MLEERAIQIRVGIFVMAGCLLAGIIIFMLGSERTWFQRKYTLRARFHEIRGLVVGAPVELAGLKIGAVAATEFPAKEEDQDIEVVMRIGRSYQDRIRKDSVVTISTQGLLGDKYITVTVGSVAEPVLKEGEYLTVKRESSIGSLIDRGNDILDHLDGVVGSLQSMIDQRSEDSLAHVLFYDPRGRSMLTDLAQSMRSLRHLTGDLDGKGVTAHLKQAAEDIQTITGQVRRGEGTLGGILTDTAIYNDLRSLFGRANRSVLLKTIVRSTLRQNDRKIVEP